jgi:hypothetical protein
MTIIALLCSMCVFIQCNVKHSKKNTRSKIPALYFNWDFLYRFMYAVYRYALSGTTGSTRYGTL